MELTPISEEEAAQYEEIQPETPQRLTGEETKQLLGEEEYKQYQIDAREESRIRRSDRAAKKREEEAAKEPSMSAKDIGLGYLSGSAEAYQDAGYGIEKLGNRFGLKGVSDYGRSVRETGKEAQNYWEDKLSDDAKKVLENQLVAKTDTGSTDWVKTTANVLTNPGKITYLVAKSLPESIIGAYAGGVAAKGLAALPKISTIVADMVGIGSVEGVQSGLQNARQVEEEILSMPTDKLAKTSPLYKELIKQGKSPEEARKEVAQTTAKETFILNTVTTGALSAPTGAVFGKIFRGEGNIAKTTAGSIAKGVATEAPQEAAQSAFEQIGQNVATKRNVNPEQEITEDVTEQTVTGFVTGGVMGGGMTSMQAVFDSVNNSISKAALEKEAEELAQGGVPEETATKSIQLSAAAFSALENIEAEHPGIVPPEAYSDSGLAAAIVAEVKRRGIDVGQPAEEGTQELTGYEGQVVPTVPEGETPIEAIPEEEAGQYEEEVLPETDTVETYEDDFGFTHNIEYGDTTTKINTSISGDTQQETEISQSGTGIYRKSKIGDNVRHEVLNADGELVPAETINRNPNETDTGKIPFNGTERQRKAIKNILEQAEVGKISQEEADKYIKEIMYKVNTPETTTPPSEVKDITQHPLYPTVIENARTTYAKDTGERRGGGSGTWIDEETGEVRRSGAKGEPTTQRGANLTVADVKAIEKNGMTPELEDKVRTEISRYQSDPLLSEYLQEESQPSKLYEPNEYSSIATQLEADMTIGTGEAMQNVMNETGLSEDEVMTAVNEAAQGNETPNAVKVAVAMNDTSIASLLEKSAKEQEILYTKQGGVPNVNNPVDFGTPINPFPQRPQSNTVQVGGETKQLPESTTYPADIKDIFVRLVGDRFYKRVLPKYVAGRYDTKNGAVLLRNMNDVSVMGHEVAHYLDYHKNKSQKFRQALNAFKAKYRDLIKSFSYPVSPDKQLTEGFAELMRAYLTDSQHIIDVSPELYNDLDDLMKQLGKKKYALVKKIQEKSHFYTWQGYRDINKAAIQPDKSFKDELYDFIENMKDLPMHLTNYIDIVHPVKMMIKDLNLFQGYGAKNLYIKGRMVTGHGESVVEAVAKYGVPTLQDDGSLGFKNDNSLSKVFEPILKKGESRKTNNEILDDFYRYMQLKQAKFQIETQGKETAFNIDNINAELPELEAREGFAEAYQKWQDFNNDMLDWYVEMSLITEESAEKFREANPFYVPTHRVVSTMEGESGAGGGIGQRRSIKGSNRQLLGVENIFNQIERNVQNALLANWKAELFSAISQSDEGAKWAAKIPKKAKRYQALAQQQAQNIAAAMVSEGLIVNESGEIVQSEEPISREDYNELVERMTEKVEETPDLATFYSYGHTPMSIDGEVIGVIQNGEQVFYEINKGSKEGRLLLTSLQGIDGKFNANFIMKMLYAVKNFKTRAITAMPEFWLGNLFVDTTTAGVFSKTGFVPGVDSVRGGMEIAKETDNYKLAVLNGINFGTRVEMATRESKQRQLMKNATKEGSVSSAMDMYDRISSMSEMSTRMGEFLRGVDQGIDPMGAAYLGVDITTDFSMHGANKTMNAIRSTTAFLPAAINSIYKDVREFTGSDAQDRKKHLASFVSRGLAYITVPALIALASQGDDDDTERTVPEDTLFYHATVMGTDIRAKVQYGLGQVFGKAPEIAMKAFKEDMGDKAWEMAKMGLYTSMIPDVAPTSFAQPLFSLYANIDFTGSPIVPNRFLQAGLTGEASYMQRDGRTRLMYESAADQIKEKMGISISPIKLQYLTRQYGGYLTKAIEDGADIVLWDKSKWGEQPFIRPQDRILSRFVYRDMGQSYWNSKYYDLKGRILEKDAEMKAILNTENLIKYGEEKISNISDINFAAETLIGVMNNFERKISTLRTLETAIRYDKDKTAKEKEKEIVDARKMKADSLKEIYKEVNEAYKQYEDSITRVKGD